MMDLTNLRPEDLLPHVPSDSVGQAWLLTVEQRDFRLPRCARLTRGPYRHAWGHAQGVGRLSSELSRMSMRAVSATDDPEDDDREPARSTSAAGAPAPDQDPRMPAGYTYFGQFLTHDLSRMAATDPLHSAAPQRWDPVTRTYRRVSLVNLRRPRLDLDSLYGEGPSGSPGFYESDVSDQASGRRSKLGRLRIGGKQDSARLAPVEAEMVENDDDLQRNQRGDAVLPDERNDENVMLSQVHLALQKAHNELMLQPLSCVAEDPRSRFLAARQEMRWRIQWLVLNDFLRNRLLHEVVSRWLENQLDAIRRNVRTPTDLERAFAREPWLPVEFVLAAFRVGHVLARSHYKLNNSTEAPIRLMPGPGHMLPSRHLAGRMRLRRNWTVHWDYFFDDRGRGDVQRARWIAPVINQSLATLPHDPMRETPGHGPVPDDFRRLSFLTLLSGEVFGLPSGQDLARTFQRHWREVEVLDAAEDTPLWLYLMREAEREGEPSGARLGRLGSWIVAETLLGLIVADEESYLRRDPHWSPGEGYTVGTLLRSGWPRSHGGDLG